MKKINILCSDCKGWIWLSPIGIWMTFVFGIFFLPENWYEETNLTDWIQSISAALTLLVAWFALSSWKNQVKHSHVENCVLELFKINEHFKSLSSIVYLDALYSTEWVDFSQDALNKSISNAGFNFFKIHLEYKKFWDVSGLDRVSCVSECHPDKINSINKEIIGWVTRPLSGYSVDAYFESPEKHKAHVVKKYEDACGDIEKKLTLLKEYYIDS